MSASLPVVLIGGWLGAGKTTLVNHLLRHAAGRRIAVLVNDFGDVDIDAELIESVAGEAVAGVLSLAGGCLCCSFGDDLVGTLVALTQRAPRPDVVLIETSGVALPAAVARTVSLATGVGLVGCCVLADAADVRRQAGDRYVGDTVRAQFAAADWILLNKADLVAPPALQATAAWLAGLAPQARVWSGRADTVPAGLLLGPSGEVEEQPPPPRPDGRAADPGAERFAHRALGSSAGASALPFESRSLALPPGADLAALGRALAAPGSGVLRAKGLARDDAGAGWLLQVTGTRWTVTPAAVRGPGRLVVIALRGQLDAAIASMGLAARPARAHAG